TETTSSFQLICGTNRNLEEAVAAGRFRDDLYQRINLWQFQLPSLSERREDIEPNVEYELDIFSQKIGQRITFNREAWKAFMTFAEQHDWRGNFRELNAVITRMATLAPGGRIDLQTVQEEIQKCRPVLLDSNDDNLLKNTLGEDYADHYDYFELVQLREVIKVCLASKTMSDAGRKLFAISRLAKKTDNDADRLARYLAHFGIRFVELRKL
ncbi:MAG: sigma 54-interacting transcriptional regulator, partial [Victivallales bacterium]|nr:sigma 54-interacting transcriptional regulator [Victivallales bacterium]